MQATTNNNNHRGAINSAIRTTANNKPGLPFRMAQPALYRAMEHVYYDRRDTTMLRALRTFVKGGR